MSKAAIVVAEDGPSDLTALGVIKSSFYAMKSSTEGPRFTAIVGVQGDSRVWQSHRKYRSRWQNLAT
jgi:hypothetical protein